MSIERRILYWLVALGLLLALLHLFGNVLEPFFIAMGIAFVLDPLCDLMEDKGVPRALAAILVIVLFIAVVGAATFVLLPLVAQQLVGFISELFDYLDQTIGRLQEVANRLEHQVGVDVLAEIRSALGDATPLVGWVTGAASNVVSGGIALVTYGMQLFIIGFVVFFLLRDFNVMVAHVNDWLPERFAPALRQIASDSYDTLAGFIRGQGLVCILLGAFYAAGLTATGLRYGLLVGVFAGLISFIPYAGASAGFLVAVGLAVMDFESWLQVGLVATIFLVGQAIEGNLLAPYLVGRRVRLHPVWVIVALYAGGYLYGFFGVLLAVPAAAVIGVMTRYALTTYLHSPLHHTQSPAEGGTTASADAGPGHRPSSAETE